MSVLTPSCRHEIELTVDPYFVTLTSSGSTEEVGAKCMFAEAYVSQIQELEPGQAVAIKGTVGDYEVDVVVNDCTFIK